MKLLLIYRHLTAKSIRHVLLFAFLLLSIAASAQSRAELERQRKQKENEIALTRKLLNETNEKRRQTVQYLSVLNKQIRSRQELIGTLQNELRIITMDIEQENDVVMALEKDMKALREEYAQLLYFMYKNKSSYNMLSFIFASRSFNEAYKRIKFIQFYSSYRKKQVELIIKTEEMLTRKVKDLQLKQAEKEAVLASMAEQKRSLEGDKQDQAKLAKKLQGDEKKLRRQLKEEQRVAQKLDRAIKDIIAREIAAAAKAAKPNDKGEIGPTPEALKLAAEFESNRARLPWPVERGIISEDFGRHEHPTIRHVIVENSGIKIRTPQGAKARCIFAGEVVAVINIPGANQSVLVKHGTYYTVYSNLENVIIKAGQKLETKQEIGTVAENKINGETELELQIRHGSEKLNPALWIYRK